MKKLIPVIAPYSPADRQAIVRGNIDLQETERALSEFCLPGKEIGELYLDHLLELNRKQKGTILVAKIDGRVVGFISCRIEYDDSVTTTEDLNTHGYISDAWTHPDYRKNGIFKKLCAAAESYLQHFPEVKVVKLNVIAGNEPAIAAYKRAGFKPQELTLVKRI
jgi:ribosomal protein S18 acetylase RimI-like enzyme